MGIDHVWSISSENRMATLDERWPKILNDVIKSAPFDVKVLCGYRDQEAQNEAYTLGNSTKQWPNSLHNTQPSTAVDLAPIVNGRIPWKDVRPWLVLAGVVRGVAQVARVDVRWGGNWDRDEVILDDQGLDDLGHFELVDK